MSKLNAPSLVSYTPTIQHFLQSPGPSLYDLESSPPQNIFPLCQSSPIQITNGFKMSDVIVKELGFDQNSNVRGAGFLTLYRCFNQQSLKPLSEVLDVILGDNFKIEFPPIGFQTDPALFNDITFKKLFIEFLRMVDSNRLSIEEAVNKYPIIDIVIIHILRSVANQHQPYPYEDKIPTNQLLKYIHEAFGMRVIDSQGDLYVFQNNCSLLDSNRVYIAYPKPGAVLQISKVHSEHTFINGIGDIKDSTFIKESNVFPHFDNMKHSEIVGQGIHLPFTRLMGNDYGKVVSSQIFPSKLQRSTYEPFQRRQHTARQYLNQQSLTSRSNMLMDQRLNRPKSTFSQPRESFVGNVGDELRKSQMRVSVMRTKESNLNNKRVSTAEIYNNEDYFGGGSTKSQILANGLLQEKRKPNGSSVISPFEEIMKQHSLTERNSYLGSNNANVVPERFRHSANVHHSGAYKYQTASTYYPPNPPETYTTSHHNYSYHYNPNSTSIVIPAPSLTNSTFHAPQVTSSYNISADGRTNTIKVQINQVSGVSPSLEAYYGDFTGSNVLEHLPAHNKSSIQEIKKSLIIEKRTY